jgi:hypothetical protein
MFVLVLVVVLDVEGTEKMHTCDSFLRVGSGWRPANALCRGVLCSDMCYLGSAVDRSSLILLAQEFRVQ